MTPSLCSTCKHVREVVAARGSRFVLCTLSQSDPSFPKYPRPPMLACQGYEAGESKSHEA